LRKITFKDTASYGSSPICIYCIVRIVQALRIRRIILYIRKRALYNFERALYIFERARCFLSVVLFVFCRSISRDNVSNAAQKIPIRNEPCISAKMPGTSATEPCISANERRNVRITGHCVQETYIFAKEFSITAK